MRLGATALVLALTAVLPSLARATAWEDVIRPASFAGYGALELEWNYNGTARMYGSTTDHNQASLSGEQ